MSSPIVSVNVMGGLGNQLFQIAAAYAYAKHSGGRLQIIHSRDNGNRPVYWDTLLIHVHPYLAEQIPSNLTEWSESQPSQYREICPLPPNGIYLHGYYQTSKYYPTEETKEEIKTIFRPSPSLLAIVIEKYQYLIDNMERVVVIHSRRTDYVSYRDLHGPLMGSYYKEAVMRILERMEHPIFVLCGDDPAYWNEIREEIREVFEKEYLILERETDIYTFALLQQFQNFIMSNSTFIWWCVWMADVNQVIVPSKWFGPSGPSEFEDIYEKEWERI